MSNYDYGVISKTSMAEQLLNEQTIEVHRIFLSSRPFETDAEKTLSGPDKNGSKEKGRVFRRTATA